MNQFRVDLHVLSPIPTTFSPTLRKYLQPQSDSLTFLVRVIRDHIDPHAWGTGSTPLLSYTSPTAFPCSGKVVNPGQETLPDSNCLELNTIHLICPQISDTRQFITHGIQTRTVRQKRKQKSSAPN